MPSALLQISPKLGIDLGHHTTKVWVDSRGLALELASCVAVTQKDQRIVAYGDEAAVLQDRLGAAVTVVWLWQAGQIVDVKLLEKFFQYVVGRVLPFSLVGPVVLLAVPGIATQDTQMQLLLIWERLGAREISLIAAPLAAAMGVGVPVADPTGALVVSAGAGLLQVACVALGTQTVVRQSHLAGQTVELAIQTILKNNHHFLVSAQVARELKESVVSLQKKSASKQVVGKSALSGAPCEFVIKSALVSESGLGVAKELVELLKQVLQEMDPALTTDVVAKGIVLTGGLSQLRGLDEYVVRKLGVCAAVAEAPTQAVIQGVGVVLAAYDQFKQSLAYRQVDG